MAMLRHLGKVAGIGCLLVLLLVGVPAVGQDKEEEEKYNPLFAPTPVEVIDKMFDMAKLTKKDVVYDLGSGDGHIVIRAAQKGVKAIGIELNPERIENSRKNVKLAGVGKLVEIRKENALKVKDIGKATVITFYMLPEFMTEWVKLNRDKLAPGTRIVSHDYKWNDSVGWAPEETVEFKGPTRTHTLYLWVVKGKE